jgi:hypothetical protein
MYQAARETMVAPTEAPVLRRLPKCLLETDGRCCSWFVASRGPCGTDSKVPAAGFCQLAN